MLVAQLDRASLCGSGGRKFESSQAQYILTIINYIFVFTINLRSNKNSLDLELSIDSENLNSLHSLGISVFLYPYNRNINSSNFRFLPYEEYTKDIAEGNLSIYNPISSPLDKIFGLSIALTIFGIVALYDFSSVLSIESLVSTFGAYTVGKSFWSDVENLIKKVTQNWIISYRPRTYNYFREDFGTIQRFFKYARYKRYKTDSPLASKMSFVDQSNSKHLELEFASGDLSSGGKAVRLISIESDLAMNNNFMFGAKITINNKFLFIKKSTEYFQCLDDGKLGVVDNQNRWLPKKALSKTTLSLGRIKFYLKEKYTSTKVLATS